MTGLERVKEALKWHEYGNQDERRRLAFLELYAHLKADAADYQKMREDQNELARLRKQVDQLAMMRGKQIPALWAENDRLREELEKAEFAGKAARISTALEDENARLREWQEKANLALRDRDVENARLRESMAAYDRLLREAEAERDRLREDRDLGKRMFDDLELQAQDYEAELTRLREELDGRPKVYFPLEDSDKVLRQRDTLLAALRQLGETGGWETYTDADGNRAHRQRTREIARAAIAEVEGES